MKKEWTGVAMLLFTVAAWFYGGYGVGKHAGFEKFKKMVGAVNDPNYDPNDWVFEEPNNPILYIDNDTLRLQWGSSIKYVELGDPCLVVTYFEPNRPPDSCIAGGPNVPAGFLIKDCFFSCITPEAIKVDPNRKGE